MLLTAVVRRDRSRATSISHTRESIDHADYDDTNCESVTLTTTIRLSMLYSGHNNRLIAGLTEETVTLLRAVMQ